MTKPQYYTFPSEAAKNLFRDLLKKKDIKPEDRDRGLSKLNTMDKTQMSRSISWLMHRKDRPSIINGEGVYVGGSEEIYSYLLKKNKMVWRRYARTIVDGKKDLKAVAVHPAVARLDINDGGRKMTEEEVLAFGKAYKFCLICGRKLTDPTSVLEGIGPVCKDRTIWA